MLFTLSNTGVIGMLCFCFQPVIPMFTQNCRETFRSLSLFRGKSLFPVLVAAALFEVTCKNYIELMLNIQIIVVVRFVPSAV